MVFHSWVFLVLLGTTLLLYHTVLRRSPMARQVMMLGASYLFYGWWDWRFLGLMIISSGIDYVAGCGIGRVYERNGDPATARRYLWMSVTSNLLILGFFKYFDFFADSLKVLLESLGHTPHWITLEVVLPVGISFYTFQSISYTVDVYRRTAAPCYNLITFSLFVSFFPQLVAGPIERSNKVIPQLQKPTPVTSAMVQSGLALILLGYFKKLALADPIAPWVMGTLADPAACSGPRLALTVYLFLIQLYADFSGYSDIARGTARLFGVELMRNFEQPLLSTSTTEWWRRWHISLMTWFKDYLYIPLGGSRVSPFRAYANIMIVMLVSGLWHGAGWNWVLWGGLNGIVLCVERAFMLRRQTRGEAEPVLSLPLRVLWRAVTITIFCTGAVFFLNSTTEHITEYFQGLFTRWGPLGTVEWQMLGWLAVTGMITFGMDALQRRTGYHEFAVVLPPFYGGLVLGAMVVAILYWSDNPGVPYFYFQF